MKHYFNYDDNNNFHCHSTGVKWKNSAGLHAEVMGSQRSLAMLFLANSLFCKLYPATLTKQRFLMRHTFVRVIKCGKDVLLWSIPSTIILKYFSGRWRALAQ